jgi:Gly-Xaa carboxypeptidase
MDEKSGFIGIMSSIESLLENEFIPTRSVVLSFGFDEEASGVYVRTYVPLRPFKYLTGSSICQGASSLANYLLLTYGKDAFALLVDEGCVLPFAYSRMDGYMLNHLNYLAGFGKEFGGTFATLGIAEKGYTDVRVEVTSPGGHSSQPPPHTVSSHFYSTT